MRYSKAEVRQIEERAEYLRQLLAENGATLQGFDPGVSFSVDPLARPYGCTSLSRVEWEWLERLLLELRELRVHRLGSPATRYSPLTGLPIKDE